MGSDACVPELHAGQSESHPLIVMTARVVGGRSNHTRSNHTRSNHSYCCQLNNAKQCKKQIFKVNSASISARLLSRPNYNRPFAASSILCFACSNAVHACSNGRLGDGEMLWQKWEITITEARKISRRALLKTFLKFDIFSAFRPRCDAG